jgi:hypothetical protein
MRIGVRRAGLNRTGWIKRKIIVTVKQWLSGYVIRDARAYLNGPGPMANE